MNSNRLLIAAILFLSFILTQRLFSSYSDIAFDSVRRSLHNEHEQVRETTRSEEDVVVHVTVTEPLNHIEEYFISFNIDSQEFSEHFEKMNFR